MGVDVRVFDIGGSSFLGDLQGAEIVSSNDLVEAAGLTMAGSRPVVAKRSASLVAELLSSGGLGTRVTGLDLSSVELGMTEHVGLVRRLRFDGMVEHREGAGARDVWKYPVAVRKSYAMKIELSADDLGPFDGALRAFGTLAGLSMDMGLELNGVRIELPMVLKRFSHEMKGGEIQSWILDLVGQAPVSGDYPSAPLGTGSLLSAAMQAPGQSLSFVAESRDVGGVGYSGLMLVKEFGFGVRDGEVVVNRYEFASRGAWTSGVTS